MARNAFRDRVNDRFAQRRRTAETDAYSYSYEQALQLMERKDVFDVTKEPAKDLERYGTHDFGRHCLLARRLLEHGVTFVQVTHSNYDTHYENFEFHIEQLGEFDRTFATLLDDLHERGMLESTLVVVMTEFGRTPKINANYGRDHWGTAWSVALGGCRIQNGAVIGKTNDNGTAVSRPRGRSRPSVPHLPAGRGTRLGQHVRYQRPPDARGRSRRRRPSRSCWHDGRAGQSAGRLPIPPRRTSPASSSTARRWSAAASIRRAVTCSPAPRTTPSSAGSWKAASRRRWSATTVGSGPSASRPTARPCSPATIKAG